MIGDETIADIVREEIPGIAAVYRFGSTAQGQEHRGSDVDLAVLPERPVDPVHRFRVQERLARLLGRDVDLVDLASCSTVMRMQVIANGVALRTFDAATRERFEDYVFSSYARLNEERRAILERVRREGTVHGG